MRYPLLLVERKNRVQFAVYDLAGQRLATLIDNRLAPGDHLVHWQSNEAASGVYLILLRTGADTAVQKVVLMK